jgi:hypothetical protein
MTSRIQKADREHMAANVSANPAGVSVLHTLRLYTGASLIGAIIGGLAFSWTGHRELAQVMGSATAMLAFFVAGCVRVHDRQR